jgi:ADP-ribose pyrophosphatase YjhB (NUDIX family)
METAIPKSGVAKNGQTLHYSVGALIKQDNKYLLIDRGTPPFGFAGLAGHVDEGEEPQQALVREIKEESGLDVIECKLLFEEELDWNWCGKGIKVHCRHLFECSVSGELNRDKRETKSIGWYTTEEIKNLSLEPVWKYWFQKLKIIDPAPSNL